MSFSKIIPAKYLNWISEILFVITALITGVNIQLNWFTTKIWQNRNVELLGFAKKGAWAEQNMTSRLVWGALFVAVIFYALRQLIRYVIFRYPSIRPMRSSYLKYDKFLYAVFLLTSLGFWGIYLDIFAALFLFVIGQIFLIYKLIMKTEKKEIQDPHLADKGKIYRLFLISGFAALIYQITWQRVLFQFYGVNIESVTIIVSIFMFGLGIGSIVGGMLSKKFPRYLPHLFILCEMIVGFFGIVSVKLMSAVAAMTLYKGLLGVSITVYGLLSIPTIFMGATLPILVSFFYKSYHNVGKTVSLLYFINTLGSALACFFTVYILFLYFGVQTSVMIAAIFNFIVVYFGYQFVRENKANVQDTRYLKGRDTLDAQVQMNLSHKLRYAWILFLAAATGFISMSQEILWIRYISYTTGGEATVFGILLGFILLGIAFGSLNAKSLCERYQDNILSIVAVLLFISAFSYHLLIPLLAHLLVIVGPASLTILLMYISAGFMTFLMGAIFPMLSHYAIKSDQAVGFSLSWIYFSNIVGSTAGPLFTGFFLLEWLPLEQNIILISALTLILGILLSLSSPKHSRRKKAYAVALSAVTILSFAFHNRLYSHLFEKLYFKRQYTKESHFKYSIQNRSGVINVIPSMDRDDTVIGGGLYDGRFNTSLLRNRNMIERAYLFAALHPHPQSVLEIGLSSGSWARVLADHPGIQSMDIVEINPGYLKLLAYYPENNSLLAEESIKIHIDDGRRWLLRNNKKFDFILMNTTFYWRSEINNLVSRDFLLLCKDHLNPGGVLYYNTTYSRDIPFTAAQVFNYLVRYENFIAVSDQPFPSDYNEKRNSLLKFRRENKPIFNLENGTLRDILDKLASINTKNMKPEILKKPDGLNIITDDNLASEFKTNKKFYSKRRRWTFLLKMLKMGR